MILAGAEHLNAKNSFEVWDKAGFPEAASFSGVSLFACVLMDGKSG